ncbi:hypothetical protein BH23BAC4_BH23BAC4_08670 [soil metagenome]
MSKEVGHGIDLLWIPLGAGGWFVRFNGRVWESVQARREQRAALDLFHTALQIHLPEGRFVVENAWPIPDPLGADRGVVVEGPVFSRRLSAMRSFRYEVRCWPDGVISDAAWAVGGPVRISDDLSAARQVLTLLASMPPRVWGRNVPEVNDMWNSNSTISWALTRARLAAADLAPPPQGRAPGWSAGVHVAQREMGLERLASPEKT